MHSVANTLVRPVAVRGRGRSSRRHAWRVAGAPVEAAHPALTLRGARAFDPERSPLIVGRMACLVGSDVRATNPPRSSLLQRVPRDRAAHAPRTTPTTPGAPPADHHRAPSSLRRPPDSSLSKLGRSRVRSPAGRQNSQRHLLVTALGRARTRRLLERAHVTTRAEAITSERQVMSSLAAAPPSKGLQAPGLPSPANPLARRVAKSRAFLTAGSTTTRVSTPSSHERCSPSDRRGRPGCTGAGRSI